MDIYHHILVATDLRQSSDVVAQKAKQLAHFFSAELSLIHTIEPLPAYAHPTLSDLENRVIETAKKEMQRLGKLVHIDKKHQRIEFGSVKTQVLHVAKELQVDLIIVGSSGRHGLSRLLGSSASAIVHSAACDVTVIRTALADSND